MFKELVHLFKRDLILGLSQIKYRMLFSILIILFIIGLQIYKLSIGTITLNDVNLKDLLWELFRGRLPKEMLEENAEFPITWFVIQMLGIIIIGNYVYEDMFEQSTFLFIRTKYRISLWISKWLYSIVTICFLYFVILVIAFIGSYFFLSSSFSFYPIMIFPFITSVLLVTIHNTLSVLIPPIYSILFLLSLLILSVYSSSPFFLGHYSMLIRHEFWNDQGFSWIDVLIYALIVLIVAFITISYVIMKKDIYPKSKGGD